MKLRHAYSPSESTPLECKDPTLAQQSMANDTDINVIVNRYLRNGSAPPTPLRMPTFGDFDQITDYRTALELVQKAERAFLRVPAALRAKLNNDPQQFVQYALDPENLEDLRKWGLAPIPEAPPEAPEPPKP